MPYFFFNSKNYLTFTLTGSQCSETEKELWEVRLPRDVHPHHRPFTSGELAHLQSLGSAVSVSISRLGLLGKGHLLRDTTGGKCPAYQNEKIKEKKIIRTDSKV